VNYFNYFTEIEEQFQRCRQSGGFLLSPLDWALIETWKEAGVPLEAVLKGIERAFDKWRLRRRKFRMINSVAYCTPEVMTAAREMAEGGRPEPSERQQGLDPARLADYFRSRSAALREAAAREPRLRQTLAETAESLDKLAAAADAGPIDDLEAVEQRLTVLEERLIAAGVQSFSEDDLLAARQEMTRNLAPYRAKMNATQLAMLEKQYLQRAALERLSLPRLSLFYLG
jgi:hypothetical protein